MRSKRKRSDYDDSKDVLVKAYPPIAGDRGSSILAEAWSYNGGKVKLQLIRLLYGKKRGKLGRITNEESGALLSVLSKFNSDFLSGSFDSRLHAAVAQNDGERAARKAAAQQSDREDAERAAASEAEMEERAALELIQQQLERSKQRQRG